LEDKYTEDKKLRIATKRSELNDLIKNYKNNVLEASNSEELKNLNSEVKKRIILKTYSSITTYESLNK